MNPHKLNEIKLWIILFKLLLKGIQQISYMMISNQNEPRGDKKSDSLPSRVYKFFVYITEETSTTITLLLLEVFYHISKNHSCRSSGNLLIFPTRHKFPYPRNLYKRDRIL